MTLHIVGCLTMPTETEKSGATLVGENLLETILAAGYGAFVFTRGGRQFYFCWTVEDE